MTANEHGSGISYAENALVISRAGILSGGSTGVPEALARVQEALLRIGGSIAVNGVIPGHIKAALVGGGGRYILSVTAPGDCRVTEVLPQTKPTWQWLLTVNVISAVSPPNDPSALLDSLFQEDQDKTSG